MVKGGMHNVGARLRPGARIACLLFVAGMAAAGCGESSGGGGSESLSHCERLYEENKSTSQVGRAEYVRNCEADDSFIREDIYPLDD